MMYSRPELLWIYYTYWTEEFDWSLPFSTQSEYEEGVCTVHPEFRQQSIEHAMKLNKFIRRFADSYSINDAKRNLSHLKQKNINEIYKYLSENGHLKFLEEAIEIERNTNRNYIVKQDIFMLDRF